jgi:AhpD family alkylhydroperoxidase
MTEVVTELVAVGAAIASDCEPCFRHHYDAARKLGVSVEDLREAVNVALAVKAAPQRKVLETAERYLAMPKSEAPASTQGCGCSSGKCS